MGAALSSSSLVHALLDERAQPLAKRLLRGELLDPHHLLGWHLLPSSHRGAPFIRFYRPGWKEARVQVRGEELPATLLDSSGLFGLLLPAVTGPHDYLLPQGEGEWVLDPYSFSPRIGATDEHLLAKGKHMGLHHLLGGRLCLCEGVEGAGFALWAPMARGVSVIGDFNGWDGRLHPMRMMGVSGVWELFIPGVAELNRYKFEIRTGSGERRIKADPLALMTEERPKNASVLSRVDRFQWQDEEWMKSRQEKQALNRPINIYELHLGSWKRGRKKDSFLTYREQAVELARYCREMGYTHVELLPITEHPLDESWGYQTSGYVAATSRFGTPEDFQAFVDLLHRGGVGVLLDWVPSHFPMDDHALARFDGSCLYEHSDPSRQIHPHWSTLTFDFGRPQVANFLLASALFWLEVMHIDGLRVDAVASMIHLDFGRRAGEWSPNKEGGREDLEALGFLKWANRVIHERHPGVLMMAEDSTATPGMTSPVSEGGIGFDLKWNLGWMHDTLRALSTPPEERKESFESLIFPLHYAWKEHYISVLSHDEVVHEKRSLLRKMPGTRWEQFANLRLLYGLMITQPGKQLLFMGGEWGQESEWDAMGELPWHELQDPLHHGLHLFVRDLNHLYLRSPALYERECEEGGYSWVLDDRDRRVLGFWRYGLQKRLLAFHNLSAEKQSVSLPSSLFPPLKELLSSDAPHYGGRGIEVAPPSLMEENLFVELAPLSSRLFSSEE